MGKQPSNVVFCTTGQAADALGVSLRTAQLWVEKGLLRAWKTDGGHRRISRESVERLLVNKKHTITRSDHPQRNDRLKVLVVENNDDLLKLYKTAIAKWSLPLDVVATNSGVEGLVLIGRETPDLLITDLRIFGTDGLQLIRNLANSHACGGMRIVVITGVDAEQIRLHGSLPKDVSFFPKPVPFSRLRESVADLVSRRSLFV